VLVPNMQGEYTESVLHSFTGSDGSSPEAGLIRALPAISTARRGSVDLTAEGRFSKLRPSAQQGVVGGNRLSHWTSAAPADLDTRATRGQGAVVSGRSLC